MTKTGATLDTHTHKGEGLALQNWVIYINVNQAHQRKQQMQIRRQRALRRAAKNEVLKFHIKYRFRWLCFPVLCHSFTYLYIRGVVVSLLLNVIIVFL